MTKEAKPTIDPQFSQRQLELLRLLSEDKSADQISAAMGISSGTVRRHLHEIYLKLGLKGEGRLAAARWYLENVIQPQTGRVPPCPATVQSRRVAAF